MTKRKIKWLLIPRQKRIKNYVSYKSVEKRGSDKRALPQEKCLNKPKSLFCYKVWNFIKSTSAKFELSMKLVQFGHGEYSVYLPEIKINHVTLSIGPASIIITIHFPFTICIHSQVFSHSLIDIQSFCLLCVSPIILRLYVSLLLLLPMTIFFLIFIHTGVYKTVVLTKQVLLFVPIFAKALSQQRKKLNNPIENVNEGWVQKERETMCLLSSASCPFHHHQFRWNRW